MLEREFVTEEDIKFMKMVLGRVGDKTTVIIEGEEKSFPLAFDTVMMKFKDMKCTNSKLFNSEEFKSKTSEEENKNQTK